jgi:2-amino-4-hydroxy-6-hydroxymethyldihydropteridine diphosphokinase
MPKPAVVYLALGSNMGDRQANLEAALQALPPLVQVLKRSPIYETAPWGITDQPDFLNMVVLSRTSLALQPLLADLKRIESDLGRLPTRRYGPRLIDIDILFYDHVVLQTAELSVPHASLHERAFVLVPLADLAPGFVHPVLGQTVRQLLAKVDTSGVKPYE